MSIEPGERCRLIRQIGFRSTERQHGAIDRGKPAHERAAHHAAWSGDSDTLAGEWEIERNGHVPAPLEVRAVCGASMARVDEHALLAIASW